MSTVKKKLTVAEKKQRKEVRATLREQGYLPEPKKPLNRKKFAEKVLAEINDQEKQVDIMCLYEAITWMVAGVDNPGHKITPEEVGVLKTLHLAKAIQAKKTQWRDSGAKQNDLDGLYKQVIKPIREL